MNNHNMFFRGRAMCRAGRLLLSLIALLAPVWAHAAAVTLKDIGYDVLPGGRVELHLNFIGGAVPQPKIFTTGNPPRIAVDFADTDSSAAKHLDVAKGATAGISAVTVGGRTRVMVELYRPSTYRLRIAGNTLVLTINNGTEASTTTTAATIDPSKALPSLADGPSVSNIDFRRGPNGEGRVLISFSGNGASADLRRDGDTLVMDVDHASLPPKLAQRLDVMDFATPVQSIVSHRGGNGGARIEVAVKGQIESSSYQSGNEYVVEVAAKKAAATDGKLAKGQDPVYNGSRVTFNFQDIPVRSALQLLADISGLNLVAADSVSGSVTLRLVNVPWDQALDVILRAKSLDKRRSGNVVWIAPQEELAKYEQSIADARLKAEDNAELVTDYVPISYGHAADIARLLTDGAKQGSGGGNGTTGSTARGFLSARGSVSFDERTNTLLIIDSPQKIRELRELIAQLDKPVQQVLIESRIVVATDNFTRELGARFGIDGRRRGSGTTSSIGGGLGIDPTTGAVTGAGGLNVNLPAQTSGGSFAVAILGRNYSLDLELSAAQTEGRSETISSPRTVVANNQEADIRDGQEIGYVTFQNNISGAPGSGTATVQFKDAVLELKVTPTITADNRIFLKIAVTQDALDHYEDAPNSGRVPVIRTRSMNTSVLVDNGQTAVLGGIYEITKIDSTVKVPGLGDIPILGALFRTTSRQNNKAELLIFVTPRILSETLQ